MRATPRYLIGSAAVLTGVILLTTVWALTREPPPLASCRLPDGAVLRLEAVTCGPIHRFKSGPYWQRLLARTPFPYLRTLAGDPMHEIRSSTPDSLMFWLSHAPESHTMSNMMLNWHPEAINERGDSYETIPRDSALIGSRTLNCWEAPVVPRRAKRLGLRVHVFAGDYSTADLMTPNPWPGPYPVWTPEQLPDTKQSGDVGVTLASLATGIENDGATIRPTRAWSEAHVRVTWKGKPSADWMPVGVLLRDPTGNTLIPSDYDSHVYTLDRHGDDQNYWFTPSFRGDEPVWKLRFELAPCALASIDPTDLWSIPSLPVPRPRVFDRTRSQFSRHEANVRLRGLAGPWAEVPVGDNSRCVGTSSNTEMTAHLNGTLPGRGARLLLVRAVDDRGRSIQPPATGETLCGDHSFTLQLAPGAKKVTLVFAVVRTRFVEFVVRPSRAQGSQGHSSAH